jgi:hypothetical protein
MVVGQDEQAPFRADLEKFQLAGSVEFFAPVPDVRIFYAAADVLVSSLPRGLLQFARSRSYVLRTSHNRQPARRRQRLA